MIIADPQQKNQVANDRLPAPAYCLIEIAGDGFIQVFGEKNLRVKIVNRPMASTAKAGQIVDQIIESVLPKPYADVFWPSMVRASGQASKLTVQDIQRIKGRLTVCQVAGGKGLQSEAANLLKVLEV